MVVFLVCWLLLGCIQPAHMVVISSNSSTNLIPLGSYVTFTCTEFQSAETFLHGFKVQIGGSGIGVLTISSSVINDLAENNIFTERSSNTLTLFAAMTNNLTVVQCHDGGEFPVVLSDAIQVIVIGPPLAPYVEFTLTSLTELVLDWEEPFTWPDHNITQYNITITSEESGQSNTIVTNQTTYSYLSPSGEVQQSCESVTFMVSAASDLGFGEPFVSDSYGLPIELEEIAELRTEVSFIQDGNPEVGITVQVPPVCVYQEAEFSLQLTDDAGETFFDSFQVYNGTLEAQFFSVELDSDTEYYLEAFVISGMQNVTKTVTFDSTLNVATTTTKDTEQSDSSASSVHFLPVVTITSVAGVLAGILHI